VSYLTLGAQAEYAAGAGRAVSVRRRRVWRRRYEPRPLCHTARRRLKRTFWPAGWGWAAPRRLPRLRPRGLRARLHQMPQTAA